jgi:cell division transport system ATP-binding protein
VVLLSGDTGAGKSVLLGMLHGAHEADDGTIEMFGRDLARLRRSSIALLRQCLGIVPADLALLDDRTALDNVALALEVRALPRREVRLRAAAALGAVGLACEVDVLIAELSLGERQRVALARAAVAEPEVILADEPSAHLDNAGRAMLIETLCAVQARGGAALVATCDHKLLAAGAHHGWRHVEISGGSLRVVAKRPHENRVIPSDDYELIEVTGEISPDGVLGPIHSDTASSASTADVVPFPLVASGGGFPE